LLFISDLVAFLQTGLSPIFSEVGTEFRFLTCAHFSAVICFKICFNVFYCRMPF
jgi:hypothetical protein